MLKVGSIRLTTIVLIDGLQSEMATTIAKLDKLNIVTGVIQLAKLRYYGLGLLCLFLIACTSTIPRIPVAGELAGQRIATTVDSELARYYLEQYPKGDDTNLEWRLRFDRIHERSHDDVPSREYLRKLSEEFSVDVATIYLAKYLLEDPDNQMVQAAFEREIAKVRTALHTGDMAPPEEYSDYRFLFVPGWDYEESGSKTGADLAIPRRLVSEIGLQNQLVEVEPNGSVERNSSLIADEIRRYRGDGKKLVLVSASSSGPAVAHALGERLSVQQLGHVAGWLNIAGVLQGVPIIDHFKIGPRIWLLKGFLLYQGWDVESVGSLSAERSRERFRRLSIPSHISIINYVGIPLSGDVSASARDSYLRLRREGPNDGTTLLVDEIVPQSLTIVNLGIDHFLNWDADLDVKTIAMSRTLLKLITEKALYGPVAPTDFAREVASQAQK